MNGSDFKRIIAEAFEPCLKKQGFALKPLSLSGREYTVCFESDAQVVDVSYEPGDDYLNISVYRREHTTLSDIDDRSKTLRLSDLNRQYMPLVTSGERSANEALFRSIVTRDATERRLLKSAKDLCLVLPKYFKAAPQ
jgi:hypothetical protein